MSTVFTTNAWERSSPFQPNSAAHTDNDSTMDAGKLSSVGLPCGRGIDEVAAQNGQPFSHSADALPAARGPVAETDVMMDSGVATVECALVLAESNKCGAVVVAHPPATFPGLYKDVKYSVRTLFAPPKPPSEMPPRVKRQPRRGPVYDNDIVTAGERQHRAQREVSRMWRGVLCRRRLRQARTLAEVLTTAPGVSSAGGAVCRHGGDYGSCALFGKSGRRIDGALHCGPSREHQEHHLLAALRYEGAAVLIQRVLRWHLREKQRYLYQMEGVPESEWPPALERPPTRKRRPCFAWRYPRPAADAGGDALAADELSGTDDDALHHRTLLQFRKVRDPVPPPTQTEVEAINAKTRERIAQRESALAAPEVLSRAEWKTENIRHEDLDFNAGVLQRLYRSKQATIKARTRQLTGEVQSEVKARMARHDAEKIEALKVEAVWQRELMDASAACIQRCYHWYRFERDGVVPASYAAINVVPTAPPYGLINEHIQRERAMRWDSMNLMEQHELEKQRHHMYLRYVPAKTIVCKRTGRFATAPQAEL
ncbi:hypothetical protein CGC20_9070 [Leishmania donovani]|uniref:Uncharacterized protein n=1 Tax=Leishmania donovani TaxID=5661 RepID=A0A504X436_LEIDO|nr:hypothetical protein CGC20_9070 [Leishmania donovani]